MSTAASAQCVASFREIKFPDGSARVKNYVCKSEGAAKPEIRVEFDRLSEAAAGSLIEGEPYPDMERAFGKVRLINNAVAVEAKTLFDKFGTKSVESNCFAFQVASAEGGKGYESNADATCEERTLWYLSFPDREGLTTVQLPLPADLEHYRTNTDWPPGFSFNYSATDYCWDVSPIACALLWRPARASDLADYDEKEAEYNRMLGLEPAAPDANAEAPEAGAEASEDNAEADEYMQSWNDRRNRYFDLIGYLTSGGWPEDFLFITGKADICGGNLNFSLHIRQMILDVAFIRNISKKPVAIDALLGAELASTALHAAGAEAAAQAQQLSLMPGQVAPGETIAVPLAISFHMASSLKSEFGDQAEAAKSFNRIQAAAPSTVFEMANEGGGTPVRKLRESFGPPTVPNPATYAFGPELRLSGLVINGKPVVFDQASRNFMQLTAGEGYGSCPYLYAWDDGKNLWVRQGKVIDAADREQKQATATKTFAGFRSKFRLAEEELEVSYIDHVKLEIKLKNGTGMTLAPDFGAMQRQDGQYATIKAGDRIEFSFTLPPTIKAEDVEQSTLAVTGYYRRYSSMMMARQ